MIFLHPQWLALLALPVILAFWEWIRRGQPIALPFDHGRQRRGLVLRFLVLCANCLPAGLLAIAILFLAHPVSFKPPEIERQLNNVQIVLDTSGSMAENHGSQANGRHRRFDSAMDAILQFINYRQGDAFGLTIFSRTYIHWLPLTLDTQSIALARPFIVPNNPKLDPPEMGRHGLPDELWGITYIGKALYGASELLAERPTGDRMIIMLTDGESSDIKPPLDQAIISTLRARNVTVFGILLTNEKIEPALVGIVRSTGGQVFNAATPEALQAVFKSIDEMKKVVVLEKKPQVADHFDPFIPPAIGLLIMSVLALFGLRFTPVVGTACIGQILPGLDLVLDAVTEEFNRGGDLSVIGVLSHDGDAENAHRPEDYQISALGLSYNVKDLALLAETALHIRMGNC